MCWKCLTLAKHVYHMYTTHVYYTCILIILYTTANKAARKFQGVSTVANTANCYGTLCGSRDGGLSLSTGIWRRHHRDGDPCCDGVLLRLAMSSSSPSRDIFGWSGLDPKTWPKLKGSQLVRCELMWVVEPRVQVLQLRSAMFSCWFCSCLPCFYRQCFGGWLDIPSGSVRGVHVQMTSVHLFGRGSDHSASLVELPMAESNRSDCHDPERFGCNTYRYIWNIYRT